VKLAKNACLAQGPSATGGEHTGPAIPPRLAGRFFLPLDWSWCVRRVLKRIQPAMLMIVETELWPNLVRVAHRSVRGRAG